MHLLGQRLNYSRPDSINFNWLSLIIITQLILNNNLFIMVTKLDANVSEPSLKDEEFAEYLRLMDPCVPSLWKLEIDRKQIQ